MDIHGVYKEECVYRPFKMHLLVSCRNADQGLASPQ